MTRIRPGGHASFLVDGIPSCLAGLLEPSTLTFNIYSRSTSVLHQVLEYAQVSRISPTAFGEIKIIPLQVNKMLGR
jgi:hypothetical protein